MAQLAIKGHATRGSEVIALLEMFGGINSHNHYGDENYVCYTINGDNEIISCRPTDKFVFFTLEEFLEKYPYKVGDKVSYKLDNTTYYISKIHWEHNKVLYDLNDYYDRCGISLSLMFGIEAEELQPYKEERQNLVVINNEDKQLKVHSLRFDKTQLVINDEYELEQNGNAYYIVRKQSKYPKSYEECCKIMGVNSDSYLSIRNLYYDDGEEDTTGYEQECLDIFDSLWELKICRDAYWKIAGEQMGLGKPWEPDWSVESKIKYVILYKNNNISKDAIVCRNTILAFPTEEMRDAFYENFKDLIEKCKMLL